MARKLATVDSLTTLFDESSRPIYAVDADRRIVYCNRALATWLDIGSRRIIGRRVEFHSEPAADDEERGDEAPLTDLCPPPQALAGARFLGTLSCMARGGRLVHRQAEFIPLGASGTDKQIRSRERQAPPRYAVLVLLATADMSAQELATAMAGETTADELHRTIRKFRRAQAGRYSIESLLGSSAAIQKVRAQVAAAAASGANTLICGPPGSGRGHVARAIHYCAASDGGTRLVPVDCQLLTDEVLRRVMDSLRALRGEVKLRATLLIENLELMSAVHQSLLLSAIRQNALVARIIATCSSHVPSGVAEVESAEKSELKDAGQEHDNDGEGTPTGHPAMPSAGRPVTATIEPNLVDAISTITIRMPRLADRLEDLPVMAQYFLEACNQGSSKQVGSLRSDALDLLALYSWPGELDQLQETIAAAHRASTSHEITPVDLPKIVHHAFRAATRTRRMPERIVLDELLGMIEKEAIVRALAQAGGNKSEAAALLGMTRPRLYRRLVQLGLAGEGDEVEREQPEFIERDPTE